jgi:predicted NBD/HSP70 family sugar kinase
VHRARCLSRAELTRRTGLSRSTVKDLVAELMGYGLVTETEPAAATQVGRPSPVVRPQTRTLAVAVNPEVDAITVGLVGLGGTVLDTHRLATDGIPTVAHTVGAVAQTVERLREGLAPGQSIAAIGVAVPGLVHGPGSLVRLAPNLEWHDAEIGQLLSESTGLPVTAANDANLGAVAEHLFGRHEQADHMIYVNGGAGGIGAGVVVDGALLDGAAGYAGELGHTYVGGIGTCHCGAAGCLETEVSQTELTEAGDVAAVRTIERQARYLGIALGNTINLFNPNLIVLGGFLRIFPDLAAGVLNEAVAQHSMRAPFAMVRIKAASLGSETLMIGAAELAFTPLLRDPATHA